jgi:hypothetical protein
VLVGAPPEMGLSLSSITGAVKSLASAPVSLVRGVASGVSLVPSALRGAASVPKDLATGLAREVLSGVSSIKGAFGSGAAPPAPDQAAAAAAAAAAVPAPVDRTKQILIIGGIGAVALVGVVLLARRG